METTRKDFEIDRATKRLALCRSCRQQCLSGDLRIAKVGDGPYNGPMKFWYHLDCFQNVIMKQRITTKRISHTSDIERFFLLSVEDQLFVLNKLNEIERNYSQKHNIEFKEIGTVETISTEENLNSCVYDFNHEDSKFETFCSLCVNISKHDKYTDKTSLVRIFFSEGSDKTGFKGDIGLWCRFLLPGSIKRIYNLKSKQLIKLFARIFKTKVQDMISDFANGNVAETIVKFFDYKKLYSINSTLSVFEIDDFLNELSKLTKEDDQINHLETIISRCTRDDLKYLIYLITGDLRMNAGPKHVLEGVHPDAYKIFKASKDIDMVIGKVKKLNSLEQSTSPSVKNQLKAEIMLMTPIQPMLAEPCKSVQMAMEKCKNGMLSEIKYDGERVQIHYSGTDFKYYSRSLKPVLDHKVSIFKEIIPKAFPKGIDMILDSEILMIDTKTGNPLPFGTLGIHKKGELKDAEVCLFIFDCLFFNGKSLIDTPIRVRRRILVDNMIQIKNRIMISKVEVIFEENDLTDMIIQVLKEGLEGLVLKDLESKYEPGKRHWLKVKKDYLFDGVMADSADLVVLGAWFGTGKKGGLLSIFLMGCYDDERNKWLTVTKVHSGHDDKTLESLQEPLKSKMYKISRDFNQVPEWLDCSRSMVPDFIATDPKNQPVWEIKGTEFTQSQIHTAKGISIRFPRVTKIRNDKCWQTATDFKHLQNLFQKSKEHDVTLLKKMCSSSSNKNNSNKKNFKNHDDNPNIFNIIDKDVITVLNHIEGNEHDTLNIKKSVNNPKSEIEFYKNKEKSNKLKRKRKQSESNSENLKKQKNGSVSKKTPIEHESLQFIKMDNNLGLCDIFAKCTLSFYYTAKLKNELNSEIGLCKRYWIAFGGKIDDNEDGSQSTHVLHFNKTVRLCELETSTYKFPNNARHLHFHWLKICVIKKKIQDIEMYSVTLQC